MVPLIAEKQNLERFDCRGGRRNRPWSTQQPEGDQAEQPKTARAN
jgi:hypothetical protein